jgi:hypothetical protein
MGALNDFAACWSSKCEYIKRCELRFSAVLGNGASELRFERTVLS